MKDNCTITRIFPSGAVTAMLSYATANYPSSTQEWCIVVFPSEAAAAHFANENNMDFTATVEVMAHKQALEELQQQSTRRIKAP